MPTQIISKHSHETHSLAKNLKPKEIYQWLLTQGYFPESYVMPPCFRVSKFRSNYKPIFANKIPRYQLVNVHFPKTNLTDRTFGVINPEIHHDIALHICKNWKTIVKCLFSNDNAVCSYTFPLPVTTEKPGRLGSLRSGRFIYEFIEMIDDDLACTAYQYSYMARADIKNFYPSVYTHSIAWAIHGKKFIRKPKNMHNTKLLGNRLDKLFQNANDGCTNGVPIGPVVSDIIAEIILSAVDRNLSRVLRKENIQCKMVRFKDDYRILTKSEGDAKIAIKTLQKSLRDFNLELNEGKTEIFPLPQKLFREWVSKYHLVKPARKRRLSWSDFRELYISVLKIDQECPNTGVIDRFLADIVHPNGRLKIDITITNLRRVASMLLMLGTLRIKAFPKIIAILEVNMKHTSASYFTPILLEYLEEYLHQLAKDEDRNKYLIAWISYFLASNGLVTQLKKKPKLRDKITRSILNNRPMLYKQSVDFKLFEGCRKAGKRVTMFEHLDIFNPPKEADE
ncbi:MAG: RNA-directed DNA polymerase [Flavobacteriales bacterium]|nr:RNA-directed DNA polymerase [Flavobacteriales bacterium]